MSFIIKDEEIKRVKKSISQGNNKVSDLWEAMQSRTMSNTKYPGIVQPEDTNEWWHIVWERLSDAAFVQLINPSESLGKWIRSAVLEICDKPVAEWRGPWFRGESNPPVGMLETTHVGVGVIMAIDLCPHLFSDEEHINFKNILKVKCQEPCRRFVDSVVENKDEINNWFVVLLNGFGVASLYLNDTQAIDKAIEYSHIAASLYNEDSYGESMQYSNYASLNLSFLNEMIIRYNPKLEGKLNLSCYTKCIPWQATSFMYMKPLSGWGEKSYPRTINFGDSAAIYRPSGDVLLHIAARMKNRYPKEAGLSKWLFDVTYNDANLGPNDRSTFGFFNDFLFLSILLYEDAANSISPESAKLPLTSSFETGTIVSKDRWENPKTVLGVQGGYITNNVAGHRHNDQNSFMLSHLKERFFVDPGHCCYRLKSQSFAASTQCHNTWSFETTNNDKNITLNQKPVKSNIFKLAEPLNKKLLVKELDGISVIISDAAEVYGESINRAERTWITAFPNILFIIDRIEARQPVKVKTHFVLNNRDGKLKSTRISNDKYEFTRNDVAMKLFQVMAQSDGATNECGLSFDWGYVHDCYHPQPHQLGQGAEGSALIYNYTSSEYKTNHLLVYAIAMDDINNIEGFIMKNSDNSTIALESPEKKCGYSIQITQGDNIIVKDIINNINYKLENNNFSRITD
ncbi:heparinase II/III-family protein [Clostridium bowmanii]|uniref:heparinase II/III domain-containing protein n=1 Tax=Clostridium bowmanii TaxID=132925 RepID=UPI001C0C969A|nr:heparinase II/III family protein [Clostridium bowmanii]MBU3191015.1 heparinase II/III-family protein [Clostridium bowmanii]MCA1075337.1 heparinase II/III-family protein [Clostridium bowmanii]